MSATRTAIVKGGSRLASLEVVRDYLPSNYKAATNADGDIEITGFDNRGWTLDRYVIPRLGSGLIVATETTPNVSGCPYCDLPKADENTCRWESCEAAHAAATEDN